MNAAVQQLPQAAAGTIKPGEVALVGRIAGKRRIPTQAGHLWLTLVKLPAPDEFTSPQTVEIRSTDSLGDIGQDIKVKARVGGFPRAYNVTDKDTGEVRNVRTADIRLDLVAVL